LITLFKSDSNEAYFGGAIYNVEKTNIDNSIFSSNKASEAGVIYSSSDLIVTNSKFNNNQITRKGGVLSLAMGNVSIDNSIFSFNTGADEGGVIFNYNSNVHITNSQFKSNKAKSYGGAIDNSGMMAITDSLFDSNQAYSAGVIDNGGNLEILRSNFTNNKATINGGAIDNNNILNIVGAVFENNVAGSQGGAIIARKDINIAYSLMFNNQASAGSAIYANNNNSNLSNNWWGSNDPDFEDLINLNVSDDFTWILMAFKSTSPLMQYENAKIEVSFNEVKNKNNSISEIASLKNLPNFNVSLSTGGILVVENGYGSKSVYVPKVSSITSKFNNQSITLGVALNPSKIIGNKNVVADYSGKVTFKVRVVGSNGKAVGQNEVVLMKISGKTYSVKTDKGGYASKAFSLLPGKYSITTSYKGFSAKNTITVKKVLKAKSATVKKAKKIKYSASLKTSKGKAISGKKITFKINGKSYTAKTNKKGIATVKFKNLKVGKYKVTVKYLKSMVKTTLQVKK
jgi:predicted outer membrane repeat protein